MGKKNVVKLGFAEVVDLLKQIDPRMRLSLVLGAFTHTAAELGMTTPLRACLAMLPHGDQPIGLAKRERWRCPLCDAEVPDGVKHKHTAEDWMTGRKVSVREVLEARAAERPMTPFQDFENGKVERRSVERIDAPGAVSPEEPPTVDESAKRRERVVGEPLRVVCAECGCDTTGGHLIGCSYDGGTPND